MECVEIKEPQDIEIPSKRIQFFHILKERYSNKRIGEEKPHVFAISDNAYTGMMATKKDQELGSISRCVAKTIREIHQSLGPF